MELADLERFVSPIMCLNRLRHLQKLLQRIPSSGDLVELGCHQGVTAAFIRCVCPDRRLVLFDAFPDDWQEFLSNHEGRKISTDYMSGTRKVYDTFERFRLHMPAIVPGWFSDTLPRYLPEQIAFAHLDSDHEGAMRESISAVYPRLVTGGICVIDDYGNDAFPGAKDAIDQFMADKPEALIVTVGKIQSYFVKDSHKMVHQDTELEVLKQEVRNFLNFVADKHSLFKVEQLECPHLRMLGNLVFPDGTIQR